MIDIINKMFPDMKLSISRPSNTKLNDIVELNFGQNAEGSLDIQGNDDSGWSKGGDIRMDPPSQLVLERSSVVDNNECQPRGGVLKLCRLAGRS